MSAPASLEEWEAFAEEFAEFRAGLEHRSVFGVDPRPLSDWALKDAAETMIDVGSELQDGADDLALALTFRVALASQTRMGIEIGLYLVASGRVKP